LKVCTAVYMWNIMAPSPCFDNIVFDIFDAMVFNTLPDHVCNAF